MARTKTKTGKAEGDAPAKKRGRLTAEEREQRHLPGTEPKINERVHGAARAYFDAMKKRIACGKKEKEAELNLLGIMAEENVEFYEYQGLHCHINTTKKPKVEFEDAKEKGKGRGKGRKSTEAAAAEENAKTDPPAEAQE